MAVLLGLAAQSELDSDIPDDHRAPAVSLFLRSKEAPAWRKLADLALPADLQGPPP